MKKIIVMLAILGLVLSSNAFSQEAKKKSLGNPPQQVKKEEPKKEMPKAETANKAKGKAAKPIKGKVVSFTNVIMGKSTNLTKDEAMKMAEKGDPIVLMVGEGKKGKIYFVYNSDGTFGGKNLAKYAANKSVGVVGKTKTVNGLNYIIAEMIESMD